MGCLQSKEKDSNKSKKEKSPDLIIPKKVNKKKGGRTSRISVAIKVGTNVRRSKVHATPERIVCVFGKLNSDKDQYTLHRSCTIHTAQKFDSIRYLIIDHYF